MVGNSRFDGDDKKKQKSASLSLTASSFLVKMKSRTKIGGLDKKRKKRNDETEDGVWNKSSDDFDSTFFSRMDTVPQSSRNVLGNLKISKYQEFKSRASFRVTSKANIYDQCNLSDSEISIGSRKKERLKRLSSLEMEMEKIKSEELYRTHSTDSDDTGMNDTEEVDNVRAMEDMSEKPAEFRTNMEEEMNEMSEESDFTRIENAEKPKELSNHIEMEPKEMVDVNNVSMADDSKIWDELSLKMEKERTESGEITVVEENEKSDELCNTLDLKTNDTVEWNNVIKGEDTTKTDESYKNTRNYGFSTQLYAGLAQKETPRRTRRNIRSSVPSSGEDRNSQSQTVRDQDLDEPKAVKAQRKPQIGQGPKDSNLQDSLSSLRSEKTEASSKRAPASSIHSRRENRYSANSIHRRKELDQSSHRHSRATGARGSAAHDRREFDANERKEHESAPPHAKEDSTHNDTEFEVLFPRHREPDDSSPSGSLHKRGEPKESSTHNMRELGFVSPHSKEDSMHNAKELEVSSPRSSLHSRRTPESSLHSRRTPESSLHSRRTPEGSLHSRRNPESSLHSRREHKQPTPESSLHNRGEHENSSARPKEETEGSLHKRTEIAASSPRPRGSSSHKRRETDMSSSRSSIHNRTELAASPQRSSKTQNISRSRQNRRELDSSSHHHRARARSMHNRRELDSSSHHRARARSMHSRRGLETSSHRRTTMHNRKTAENGQTPKGSSQRRNPVEKKDETDHTEYRGQRQEQQEKERRGARSSSRQERKGATTKYNESNEHSSKETSSNSVNRKISRKLDNDKEKLMKLHSLMETTSHSRKKSSSRALLEKDDQVSKRTSEYSSTRVSPQSIDKRLMDSLDSSNSTLKSNATAKTSNNSPGDDEMVSSPSKRRESSRRDKRSTAVERDSPPKKGPRRSIRQRQDGRKRAQKKEKSDSEEHQEEQQQEQEEQEHEQEDEQEHNEEQHNQKQNEHRRIPPFKHQEGKDTKVTDDNDRFNRSSNRISSYTLKKRSTRIRARSLKEPVNPIWQDPYAMSSATRRAGSLNSVVCHNSSSMGVNEKIVSPGSRQRQYWSSALSSGKLLDEASPGTEKTVSETDFSGNGADDIYMNISNHKADLPPLPFDVEDDCEDDLWLSCDLTPSINKKYRNCSV